MIKINVDYINGRPVDPVAQTGEGLEIAPEDTYQLPREEKIEAPEIGIIKELNPAGVLEQLKNALLSRVWDDNEKKYKKFGEPLMSEQGVGMLMSSLLGPVSSLTTFSNYPDEQLINENIFYACEQVIPTVHVNYQEYGIKDKCHLPIIDGIVYSTINSAFRKALGAGERNLLRGVVSEQIRSGMPQASREERKSVWSKLSPFGRK